MFRYEKAVIDFTGGRAQTISYQPDRTFTRITGVCLLNNARVRLPLGQTQVPLTQQRVNLAMQQYGIEGGPVRIYLPFAEIGVPPEEITVSGYMLGEISIAQPGLPIQYQDAVVPGRYRLYGLYQNILTEELELKQANFLIHSARSEHERWQPCDISLQNGELINISYLPSLLGATVANMNVAVTVDNVKLEVEPYRVEVYLRLER